MSRIRVTKSISAPVDIVFNTISDIRQFSEAVPGIVDIEILTDQKIGVGTRFRETRLMNGKETSTELEVTDYSKNEFIRIVAESNGTVWDSLFTVKEQNGKTQLELVMDADSNRLLPKLVNLMMKRVMKNALEKDMEAVRAYCEQ